MSETESGHYFLAADTGGTFTDIAVQQPNGELFVWKVPSTPEAPDDAVLTGVTEAFDEIGASLENVQHFVHGTTVATNTVLTRTGARVGLLTTKGFRDILRIGWQARPSLYDQYQRNPEPLVAVEDIREIDERMSSEGEILKSLDPEEIRKAYEDLVEAGVDVIVVSFLNAYTNAQHEREAIAELSKLGDLELFAASLLSPEIREFERTSTGAINAYIQPKISNYIARLQDGASKAGIGAPLWIMQSNGGLISPQNAEQEAARTILSGLAGGVTGAASWARMLGMKNVVSFDIGGTSTDIAMIRDGEPDETQLAEIGGLPLRMPAIDVHTIGAGGGSIAWRDSGGGLRMGPHSAGAVPGPVAYDQGGEELTVTDAHLVLGRLGEELLGGRFKLNKEAALRRMEVFAEEVGLSVPETAEGMIRVINATMARGVRKVSVERGVDTRNCDLMAFGGAGPLHAAELLAELDMRSAVIPPQPGIASAVGMLDAPQRHDYSSAVFYRQGDDLPVRDQLFYGLLDQADELDVSERAEYGFFVDARYAGQSFELTIDHADDWDKLREIFDQAHLERYGFADPDAKMEIVVLRLVVTDRVAQGTQLQPTKETAVGEEPKPLQEREVYFDGEWQKTPVYRRTDLVPEQSYVGPMILEQFDSTILVRPQQQARQDERGFLHLQKVEA
ncbi:hydantoinase/oxoprolinase family protein [Micrococcoides hystricis]|uniref:Hydantoinase/oxoprolinase family protein n=1 Tax=Micrococcoides hystricis TaxID=1572761 RepID=A0ABV6P8Y6_9MICC